MADVTVITKNNLGKGLTHNPITKLVDLAISEDPDNVLGLDNENKLKAVAGSEPFEVTPWNAENKQETDAEFISNPGGLLMNGLFGPDLTLPEPVQVAMDVFDEDRFVVEPYILPDFDQMPESPQFDFIKDQLGVNGEMPASRVIRMKPLLDTDDYENYPEYDSGDPHVCDMIFPDFRNVTLKLGSSDPDNGFGWPAPILDLMEIHIELFQLPDGVTIDTGLPDDELYVDYESKVRKKVMLLIDHADLNGDGYFNSAYRDLDEEDSSGNGFVWEKDQVYLGSLVNNNSIIIVDKEMQRIYFRTSSYNNKIIFDEVVNPGIFDWDKPFQAYMQVRYRGQSPQDILLNVTHVHNHFNGSVISPDTGDITVSAGGLFAISPNWRPNFDWYSGFLVAVNGLPPLPGLDLAKTSTRTLMFDYQGSIFGQVTLMDFANPQSPTTEPLTDVVDGDGNCHLRFNDGWMQIKNVVDDTYSNIMNFDGYDYLTMSSVSNYLGNTQSIQLPIVFEPTDLKTITNQNGELPLGTKDGDHFEVTHKGLFNNGWVLPGDIVTVRDNQSKLIINRPIDFDPTRPVENATNTPVSGGSVKTYVDKTKVEIDNRTIGEVNGKLEVKIDTSGSNILYSTPDGLAVSAPYIPPPPDMSGYLTKNGDIANGLTLNHTTEFKGYYLERLLSPTFSDVGSENRTHNINLGLNAAFLLDVVYGINYLNITGAPTGKEYWMTGNNHNNVTTITIFFRIENLSQVFTWPNNFKFVGGETPQLVVGSSYILTLTHLRNSYGDLLTGWGWLVSCMRFE